MKSRKNFAAGLAIFFKFDMKDQINFAFAFPNQMRDIYQKHYKHAYLEIELDEFPIPRWNSVRDLCGTDIDSLKSKYAPKNLLAFAIKYCPNLQKINITISNEESCDKIKRSLCQLTNLKSIEIEIKDGFLRNDKEIMNSLRELPKLRELSLIEFPKEECKYFQYDIQLI